jgi:HlyD family secretion protein
MKPAGAWLLVVVVVSMTVGCARRPQVEAVTIAVAAIEESFVEPAQTRVARLHTISMPVTGLLARVALEPGDAVVAGQPLVEIDREPFRQRVAEARARLSELEAVERRLQDDSIEQTMRAEMLLAVAAMAETRKAASAEIEAARRRQANAARVRDRLERLRAEGGVSEAELDEAQLQLDLAEIELSKRQLDLATMLAVEKAVALGPRMVEQTIERKTYDRQANIEQRVQVATLVALAERDFQRAAPVLAPLTGVVLARHERGERELGVGTPLLAIGDLGALEAICDVRSEDALRLVVGGKVELDSGLVGPPLIGTIQRIEPQATTQRSALGIEQQRVVVVIALPRERPATLGDGYRLRARFIVARREQALLVPRAAVLQDVERAFYALAIVDGKLERRALTVGLRSDQALEVLSGLRSGERVVSNPEPRHVAGLAVEIRPILDRDAPATR